MMLLILTLIFTTQPGQYVPIGYRGGVPILRDVTTNELFSLSQSNDLTPVLAGSALTKVTFINDCSWASIESQKNSVLIHYSDSTFEYRAMDEIYSVSLSEDCGFVAFSTADSVFVYRGRTLAACFKGGFPALVGNSIYYSVPRDQTGALVDLLRRPVGDLSHCELVIEKVFEANVLIIEGGQYVLCEIPKSGKPTQVVYNTLTKKLSPLEEIKYGFNNFVYFPSAKSLYYLNQRDLIVSERIKYE